MSQYSGRQGRGASRKRRADKRAEAEARQGLYELAQKAKELEATASTEQDTVEYAEQQSAEARALLPSQAKAAQNV